MDPNVQLQNQNQMVVYNKIIQITLLNSMPKIIKVIIQKNQDQKLVILIARIQKYHMAQKNQNYHSQNRQEIKNLFL